MLHELVSELQVSILRFVDAVFNTRASRPVAINRTANQEFP
jgi:hypothetical protein